MKDLFADSEALGHHKALAYAFLFLAPVAVYLKSVSFDFLYTWDDAVYVVDNILIRSLSFENLAAIFTSESLGNYAPLHTLSYALGYRLWGGAPAGYHAVNVLVHALNACLTFAVVRAITKDGRVAALAGLLVGVHPVNVENVAWISESKTLFAGLCSSLSLLSYLRSRREPSGRWYAASVVLFIAGILFKVSTVGLPLVLFAHDVLIARDRTSWPRIVPFIAVSAAAAGLAVWAQAAGGAVDRAGWSADFLVGMVYPTMVPVFWKYLGLLFFPFNLSGHYDTTIYRSFLDLPVLLSLVATAAGLAVLFWKGSGQVRFWGLWYCLFLLPVSNLVPLPVYYADRYLYKPEVGVFVLVGLAAREVCVRLPTMERWVWSVLLSLTVACGAATVARLDVWRNDLAFWEDTVRTSPNIYKARLNLGIAYEMADRLDAAERELQLSLQLRPTEEARYHLAMVRAKREYLRGRTRE